MVFAETAVTYAWATGVYLLGYGGVLVVAPLASALLQCRLPGGFVRGASRFPGLRWWFTGIVLAPTANALAARLQAARGARAGRAPLAVILSAHLLTPYHFLFIGPLLGKDVLLSHLGAVCVYGILLYPLWRHVTPCETEGHKPSATPVRARTGEPDTERGCLETAARAIVGIAPHVAVGLVFAGVVAAWGLSPAHVVLATAFGGGVGSQAVNAVVGGALGVACGFSPVAALFVATYLWKTGIAHAGLASFLLAGTVAWPRLLVYRRVFGTPWMLRGATVMVAASVLAGILVAIAFHVLGLTIHYKLVAEQML